MKTKVVNLLHDRYQTFIGRPGIWGNPFIVGIHGTRQEVVQKYREYLLATPALVELARKELKGKVLGCFCKPLECHGDVLVELIENANTNTD